MSVGLPKDPAIDYLKLGTFQAEYATGSRWHYTLIVAMLALTALSVAAAGFFVILYFADPQIPGIGIGGMVAFGVLTIFPLVGLFFYLDKLSWRVLLFAHGFVMDRNKRFEMILWDQIKNRFEKRVITDATDPDHWMRIDLMSGGQFTLDHTFADITTLARRIREGSRASLLSRALARLGLKEPVHFGKLKLYPDGLANAKERIKWDLVECVAIEPGASGDRLLVRKKGEPRPWYSQVGSECPNIELAVLLAERLRPPPPEAAAS